MRYFPSRVVSWKCTLRIRESTTCNTAVHTVTGLPGPHNPHILTFLGRTKGHLSSSTTQRSDGRKGDHYAQKELYIGDIPRVVPSSIRSLYIIQRENRSNSAQKDTLFPTGFPLLPKGFPSPRGFSSFEPRDSSLHSHRCCTGSRSVPGW